MHPCQESETFKNATADYTLQESQYCPLDESQLVLGDDLANDHKQVLALMVVECPSERLSLNSVRCATDAEKDDFFGTHWFQLTTQWNYINLNSFDNILG